LAMLREDMNNMGAEDLHQLQRVWELHHRLIASESVTRHTLFREETRWPGYYYRGDHMKLDDKNWHCFTLSRYDRNTGEWQMEKAAVDHMVDGPGAPAGFPSPPLHPSPMTSLVRPHGGKDLRPLLLEGEALAAERARAAALPCIRISSRERGDLVMLGIGG